MMDFSCQYIPYNRELFAFLSGKQMGISHGHGDVLMAHELLQLHERHLAGLRQPRGEGMPHGMQGDGIQTVAVFRGQIELSDGGLETGGCFFKRRRWVPQACAYTPGAFGSYPPARGRRPAFLLSG